MLLWPLNHLEPSVSPREWTPWLFLSPLCMAPSPQHKSTAGGPDTAWNRPDPDIWKRIFVLSKEVPHPGETQIFCLPTDEGKMLRPLAKECKWLESEVWQATPQPTQQVLVNCKINEPWLLKLINPKHCSSLTWESFCLLVLKAPYGKHITSSTYS